MLINFSNHPSNLWSQEQLDAAQEYGAILDFPFPTVPSSADSAVIVKLAERYCNKLIRLSPSAVLVQGEMSLAFAVVSILISNGIPALCACSERECICDITADGATIRHSVFRFVRFREYDL